MFLIKKRELRLENGANACGGMSDESLVNILKNLSSIKSNKSRE